MALVDEEPILLSDVERRVALDALAGPGQHELATARRAALNQLIEERLLSRELDRQVLPEPTFEELEREVARLVDKLGGTEALRLKLAEVGLTESELKRNLARQLRLYRALEDRLGPRVFVSPDEIRRHYEEVLLPDLSARGLPAVELDDVRASIRELLFQQKFDREFALFLAELRRRADVVDLLDRPEPPLPPLTHRVSASGGKPPRP